VCDQMMVEIDIKFDTIIYHQSQGIAHDEFEGFQKFTHGLWVVRFRTVCVDTTGLPVKCRRNQKQLIPDCLHRS